jgi:hypothetical protein
MAKKSGNGGTAEFGILVDIRDQLVDMKSELKGVNTRLDKFTKRIDGVLEITGDRYRGLDERLREVEHKLGIG